ncbi:hypothetical protein B0F90DRAFT_977892 [Multifurca ochricompacta]|uniref:Uncharacterized protein n=1 Tax=Multifurca ochricompacta TaxID=376703 RepID=A0AAD4QLQ9_9AGAM|nr:hypothetical protein B0F90DRAFT_977892 [Multifurca ochricompacta]
MVVVRNLPAVIVQAICSQFRHSCFLLQRGVVLVGDRMHERDRERERDRRWSLSDPRRPDSDRRPFDNDRRPSSDDRRLPSYDRRPPHVVDERRPLPNDDRRPSYLEDKRSPGFVDRRLPDDRHFADYERRPLSEENRFGTAQSQDPSQELHLGNERRLSATLASKTRVPAALPSSPAPSSGIVGTPATVSMASGPLDPTQGRVVTGERRPTLAGGSTSSMAFDSQRVSTSRYVVPLEERSNQLSSLPERVSSSTHPQLGQRSESMRPGILVEGRLSKPLENLSVTPASLGGSTNQAAEDLSRARVSEPSHAIDSRPGMNSDRERFSLSTADDRTRSVPAAYSHALSVGRDESRLQPPPPPPPHVSTPSGVSSAHSSLPLRAREPSRERPPPNFRPYFRSEFSRPTDDDRRLDVHSYPSGDGFRRYDERGRWSPPPYGDRRSYREFYDRDRTSWDSSSNKDRARDRPQPPPQLAPSHWERERERERARYPEPSYTTSGPERRFEDREQGNRERWYPSSYDDPSRRPPPPPPPAFDTFSPRGRPRSPGSPREHGELRPPPLKRARDDGYVTGEEYYSHRSSAPLNILSGKEPLPPPQPIPIPVPIPIPRPVSPPLLSQLPLPPQQQQAPLPPPPSSSSSSSRYNNHSRLPPVESYVGTYGGYERSGPGYVREGPR